jgi:5' nucleotidase, deoxy (Pyrimidine), cytosolic type C protein (NT5C)
LDTTGTSNFVLGIDLDGVCADFVAGIRPLAAEWLGVPADDLTTQPSHDFPEWNLEDAGGFNSLYRWAVTRRELFKRMPPMINSALTLRRLYYNQNIRIRLITYRLYFEFFHKVAIDQTVDWLDHHDFPYCDLCFMREKAAVGADLYVEDNVANIQALRDAGKEVIAFGPQAAGMALPRAASWQEAEPLIVHAIERWRQSNEGQHVLAGN